MNGDGRPPAEIEADRSLVSSLLRVQCPSLAHHRLRPVASGWDNWMFRLGDRFAVRLPRRQLAVPLIEHERRWLPSLASTLPVPIPVPVFWGAPCEHFAYPWNVVRWVEGETAERRPLAVDAAPTLATFLRALHRPAPEHAPHNPYRGVSLATRREAVQGRLDRLSDWVPDLAPARVRTTLDGIWRAAVAAPLDVAPTWIHGDLHPRNVLVDARGNLAGVVDWGDLCAGDRASDLCVAWLHFEPEQHDRLWRAYGQPSPDTLARVRGWAIFYGTILIEAGTRGDPGFLALGRAVLRRVLAQPT